MVRIGGSLLIVTGLLIGLLGVRKWYDGVGNFGSYDVDLGQATLGLAVSSFGVWLIVRGRRSRAQR